MGLTPFSASHKPSGKYVSYITDHLACLANLCKYDIDGFVPEWQEYWRVSSRVSWHVQRAPAPPHSNRCARKCPSAAASPEPPTAACVAVALGCSFCGCRNNSLCKNFLFTATVLRGHLIFEVRNFYNMLHLLQQQAFFCSHEWKILTYQWEKEKSYGKRCILVAEKSTFSGIVELHLYCVRLPRF